MKKCISFCIMIALLASPILTWALKIEEYNSNRNYRVWDRVISNEKIYECTENNGTNQCNFWEDYAPGTGTYWKRTWVIVDDTTDDSDDTTDTTDTDTTGDIDISKIPWNPRITNQSKTLNTWSYTISWEMASSENPGTTMKLYENNNLLKSIQAKTGEVLQKGSFDISGKKDGKYTYSVYVCNKSGSERCAKSNSVTITVSWVGKWTSTTTTTSTTWTSSTSSTSSTTTTSTSSSVKRTDIPSFEKLPRDRSFEDFGKVLEKKLRSEIQSKKLTKQWVRDYITVVDGWIDYLKTINRKWQLTGQEKRTIIILQMMKEILQKLD